MRFEGRRERGDGRPGDSSTTETALQLFERLAREAERKPISGAPDPEKRGDVPHPIESDPFADRHLGPTKVMEFSSLESPVSIRAYAEARAQDALIILREGVTRPEAELMLAKAFEAEIVSILSHPNSKAQLVTDHDLKEKIKLAVNIRGKQLGLADHQVVDRPFAFLIVPDLDGSEAVTKGYSGLILISDPNIQVHTLAHELGHSGARRIFEVKRDDFRLIGCGYTRGSGSEGRMLEELSSMSLSAAALKAEGKLHEAWISWTLPLKPDSLRSELRLIEIGLSVHHSNDVKVAKEAAGEHWLEYFIKKANEEGRSQITFDAPSYAAAENLNWSVYDSPLRALDLLAAEIWPELSAHEAAETLQGDLVFGQAISNFSFVLGLLEREYGAQAINFFGRLEGAWSSKYQFSKILFSFFAEAQKLPTEERSIVRNRICEVLREELGDAPNISREFNARPETVKFKE